MSPKSQTEQCLREAFKTFDREELEVMLSSYFKMFTALQMQVTGLDQLTTMTFNNLCEVTEKQNAEASLKIKAVFKKFESSYKKVIQDFEARN